MHLIRNFKIFVAIFAVGLFVASPLACNNDFEEVPYEYVNFSIDLNDPDFTDLNAVGNAVMVTGGYRGIIIYRRSSDEFMAFDRACTYKPYSETVRLEPDGKFALDTVCGSRFALSLDASPVEGPAKVPLKQYQTSFSPTSNTLFVFN